MTHDASACGLAASRKYRKFRHTAIAFLTIAFLSGKAFGATYYVCLGGNDGAGDGSTNTPWASVTNAMAHASTNDSIFVSAGVYTQNVTFTSAHVSVTLQGGYNTNGWFFDPANQRTTIYSKSNSIITITGVNNATNTLKDLTLCGATNAVGRGLAILTNCTLFVERCAFTNNGSFFKVVDDRRCLGAAGLL